MAQASNPSEIDTPEFQCPVCEGASHRVFCNLFRSPDHPVQFVESENAFIVRCDGCDTLLRWPIEILHQDEESKYGESYYNQIGSQESFEQSAKSHIQYQINHYDQLHEFLLNRVSSETHLKWLDVGSCGAPTAYPDFEFTTVEPDPRIVGHGRKLFHPDRVLQGTIQSYQRPDLLDGVVFHDSLYCISDPHNALSKAAELLRPGGMLVVRIGGYFCDTHDFAQDPYVHRLEDVIRGDVMWVYYSLPGLRIMCARHGFSFVGDEVQHPAYSNFKSHRYMVFEKTEDPIDAPTITDVKRFNRERLDSLQENFSNVTKTTLSVFDRNDAAFIGPLELLRDFAAAYPFQNKPIFFDADAPEIGGVAIGGVMTTTAIQSVTSKKGQQIVRHMVFADYKSWTRPLRIAMSRMPLNNLRLFQVNRRSGKNRLIGRIEGRDQPIKGAAVNEFNLVDVGNGKFEIKLRQEFVRWL